MQKNLSKKERGAYWQGQVQEWERSGESRMGFCRDRNLKYDLFLYYSRRYARPSQAQSLPLTPVKMISTHHRYELVFPSGVILKFSTEGSLLELIKLAREQL